MSDIISRKEFDILKTLAIANTKLSQRKIEDKTGYSLGTINRISQDLTEKGYISDGRITPLGLDVSSFKVKKRFRCRRLRSACSHKLTSNLVIVNGQRILRSTLPACCGNRRNIYCQRLSFGAIRSASL